MSCLASVLLVVAAGHVVVANQGDVRSSRAFLGKLRRHLDGLGKVRCPTGSDAAWNEFCDSANGTVTPCPTLNDESDADFYTNHCILNYIFAKANDWPDDAFTSDSSTQKALAELYENLPPEHCGFNSSDSCKRDESVCSRRDAITEGVCLPLKEVCRTDGEESLCRTGGQPYLLKKLLFPSSLFGDFLTLKDRLPEWMYRYFALVIIVGFISGMVVVLVLIILLKRACKLCMLHRQRQREGQDPEGSHKLLKDHPRQEKEEKTRHASKPASIASSLAVGTRPNTLTIPPPSKDDDPSFRVTPV